MRAGKVVGLPWWSVPTRLRLWTNMPKVTSEEVECDMCCQLFVPVDDWNTVCSDCNWEERDAEEAEEIHHG